MGAEIAGVRHEPYTVRCRSNIGVSNKHSVLMLRQTTDVVIELKIVIILINKLV